MHTILINDNLKTRRKVAVTFMATMLAVTFFTPLLPRASATPIIIASIDPDSGPVGTIVRVIGEIDTLGGSYQIWWDWEILLKEGNCSSGSKEVDDTFTVPSSSEGVHDVVLVDITTYTESAPVQFVLVTLSYTMSIEPARIQEGLNTTITVGVQGAAANKNYTLTTIVTTPTTASYTADLTVTTDEVGFGTVSKIYWGEFPGANTHFVGTYSVAVNESLATGNFTVGLTDKLVYGTTEPVYIRGSGYYPNENVTVNIKFGEASVAGYPKNMTADMEGVVIDSWNIPIDAATGTHIVTLVSAITPGTIKEPADVQEFSVELICQIQTRNLNDEPVADVTVEVYNATTNEFLTSEETNETGWATFSLDLGNYTFKAFWMYAEVGSLPNQSINQNVTLPLQCQLTHLKIAIKDEADMPLPLIGVTLNYTYTTRYGATSQRSTSFETDFTGTTTFINILRDINCTIETRRYGALFNTTLIEKLAAQSWNNITITCPTYTMLVHVVDATKQPLQNVQVATYEWSGEILIGSDATDEQGNATFQCTFGRYKVKVYNYSAALGREVVLNETVIDLIEDQLLAVIDCKILNIEASVLVIDYFGRPIPNAEVKVERKFEQEYTPITTLQTGYDGMASLLPIGGDYRISVYVRGRLCETRTTYIDESKVIVFKIDKYVTIGGLLLETSELIVIISLAFLVAAFTLALTYRRLLQIKIRKGKPKPQKE